MSARSCALHSVRPQHFFLVELQNILIVLRPTGFLFFLTAFNKMPVLSERERLNFTPK